MDSFFFKCHSDSGHIEIRIYVPGELLPRKDGEFDSFEIFTLRQASSIGHFKFDPCKNTLEYTSRSLRYAARGVYHFSGQKLKSQTGDLISYNGISSDTAEQRISFSERVHLTTWIKTAYHEPPATFWSGSSILSGIGKFSITYCHQSEQFFDKWPYFVDLENAILFVETHYSGNPTVGNRHNISYFFHPFACDFVVSALSGIRNRRP